MDISLRPKYITNIPKLHPNIYHSPNISPQGTLHIDCFLNYFPNINLDHIDITSNCTTLLNCNYRHTNIFMDAWLYITIAPEILHICTKFGPCSLYQSRDIYSQANLGNYLVLYLTSILNDTSFGYSNVTSSHNYSKNIILICLKLTNVKRNIIWHELPLHFLVGLLSRSTLAHDERMPETHQCPGLNSKLK